MAELETSVVTDVLLPIALAILMFGMGLSTPPKEFAAATKKPKGLLFGLAGQLVALPLLAVLTVIVFHKHIDQDIAIGILLLGALPGGSTSNVLAHICRGDTALSIILTTITSITALLTTPLILLGATTLLYGDGIDASLPISDVVGLVLAIITIPVLAGIGVARWKPNLAAASDKPFRIAGIIVLALVVAIAIYGNRDGFWDKAWQSVPAALFLNVLALGAGFGLGQFVDAKQRRSLTIEVGFQNGTLGILIATTQLDSASIALVPAFYSLVMFVTGGMLAALWGRKAAANDVPQR
jgi:BASS family bile acid:Na+ symporter